MSTMRPAVLLLLLPAAAIAARPPPAAPEDGPSRGPGFAIATPVTIEAVVHEDTPGPELQELARIPGVRVRMRTAGNMLRPPALSLLRRLDGGALRLSLPLARAHVEQVQKLEGVPVELDLGEGRPGGATLALLAQMGPRPLTVRLDASRTGLGERERALLRGLPPARVVVSFGDRGPGPAELAALGAHRRLRAEVEVAAGAPPETVRGALSERLPVRVVASEDRVPAPLLAELARARVPVAVELSGGAALSDVARLGAVPALRELTFRLDRRPSLPAGTRDRLAAVRPPPLAP